MDTVVALVAGFLLISALVFAVGAVLAIFSKADRRSKVWRRAGSSVASFVFALIAAGFMSDGAQEASRVRLEAQQIADVEAVIDPVPAQETVAARDTGPTIGEYRDMSQRKRRRALGDAMESVGAPDGAAEDFAKCIGYYVPKKNETLRLAEVLTWCVQDKENRPDVFAAFFNELDAPDFSTEAYIICQNHVTPQLVSPGSAKYSRVSTFYRDELRYVVRAYVDSQNRFGALIRTNFLCDIQFTGANSSDWADPREWTLHNLEVES